MTIRIELIAAAVVAALATAGCGSVHRGEPLGPRVAAASSETREGQELFFQYCSQCHPGGAGGLGPSINDRPLPGIAIKTQIRAGVGAMPSFGSDQLSDDDVDAIVHYVTTMMATPPTYTAARHARRTFGPI